eukprot:PITA_10652
MSILLNGTHSEAFTSSRGLRQGHPLSPFLFILTVEGLGRLVKAQVSRDQIKGLRICGDDIPVSHQQFVDDVMLYRQAALKEAQRVVKTLSQCSKASRMEINKDKSEVFFFNTSQATQRFLAHTLGFNRGTFPSKYLGILLHEHQFRRITLLKVVLQAIHNYQILCQAVSKTASQKLVTLFKNFLWQGTRKSRNWALISWEWLSRLSKDGGLGLRDPFILNQVMGAKVWWRWIQGGPDLWKVIWERKYDVAGEIEERLRSTTETRGSVIWNLARRSKDLIRDNSFWEIRAGDKAKFWEESW